MPYWPDSSETGSTDSTRINPKETREMPISVGTSRASRLRMNLSIDAGRGGGDHRRHPVDVPYSVLSTLSKLCRPSGSMVIPVTFLFIGMNTSEWATVNHGACCLKMTSACA